MFVDDIEAAQMANAWIYRMYIPKSVRFDVCVCGQHVLERSKFVFDAVVVEHHKQLALSA